MSVTPIIFGTRKRRRRDVLRWAQILDYKPAMSADDPEKIYDFIGKCINAFPKEFTQMHGAEILRWHKEEAPAGGTR